jgi:SAM-dependent methyltransferase
VPLALNRVINLEDFEEPAVRSVIRDVFAGETERAPDFPTGHEHRKQWEIAMAVLSLREHGALRADAQVLGVGAGAEATAFWLTNHVGRVWATDLYADAGVWDSYAPTAMLAAPGLHWDGPWNSRRLVVQHMDARSLAYEDETFDAVFSSSSIEHFGSLEQIGTAIDEICRVLKPGGIASLSTEFLIEGDPLSLAPGIVLFDRELIERVIVGDRDWAWITPPDYSISPATLDALIDDAVIQKERLVIGYDAEIRGRAPAGTYPYCVLRAGPNVFTSVHLALAKSPRPSATAPPPVTTDKPAAPVPATVAEPAIAATPLIAPAPLTPSEPSRAIAPSPSRSLWRDALKLPYRPLVWRLNRNDQHGATRADALARQLDELERRLAELETRARSLETASTQLVDWSGHASGQLERALDAIIEVQRHAGDSRERDEATRQAMVDWAAVISRALGEAER